MLSYCGVIMDITVRLNSFDSNNIPEEKNGSRSITLVKIVLDDHSSNCYCMVSKAS